MCRVVQWRKRAIYVYSEHSFSFFQIEELQNKLVEAETDKNVSLDQLQQKELEIQKLVSEKNCKSLRVYFLFVLGKAALGYADNME